MGNSTALGVAMDALNIRAADRSVAPPAFVLRLWATLACLALAATLLPACASHREHHDDYRVSSSEGGSSGSSNRSLRPRSAVGIGVGLGGAGLKQATEGGNAPAITLPRDTMNLMFGHQNQFQPSPEQIKAIEDHAKSLSGPDRERLDKDLEACRKAPTCVVTPAPERPRS